jgi:AraC family transcriptional regulator
MLLNGSCSLSDIAIESGFADQSHFTKTFRRVTGTTPAGLETSSSELTPTIRKALPLNHS